MNKTLLSVIIFLGGAFVILAGITGGIYIAHSIEDSTSNNNNSPNIDIPSLSDISGKWESFNNVALTQLTITDDGKWTRNTLNLSNGRVTSTLEGTCKTHTEDKNEYHYNLDSKSNKKTAYYLWLSPDKDKLNLTEILDDGTRWTNALFFKVDEFTQLDITTATLEERRALMSAKYHLRLQSFSYEGLIDQLEFDGFTPEDAKYAADNCGADWNKQAEKVAESYMKDSSFSKEELIEQLEYEGFTHAQAVHGAASVNHLFIQKMENVEVAVL